MQVVIAILAYIKNEAQSNAEGSMVWQEPYAWHTHKHKDIHTINERRKKRKRDSSNKWLAKVRTNSGRVTPKQNLNEGGTGYEHYHYAHRGS